MCLRCHAAGGRALPTWQGEGHEPHVGGAWSAEPGTPLTAELVAVTVIAFAVNLTDMDTPLWTKSSWRGLPP